MSQYTKIEWADHTFNPWIGCQAISPGCANCYAAAWAKRYGRDFATRTLTKTWALPKLWNAQAEAFHAQHGRRQRVFCASLADVFDNEVDPQWRADLFALIEATPNLDWLLLTKRIGNVRGMVPPAWLRVGGWPKHVRVGITIVNQPEADRDICKLLALPCPNFLSMEPLLGLVDLSLPTRLFLTGRGPYGKDEPIAMCNHCCNGDRCDDPTHCDRGRPDWQVKCHHCRGTGRGKPIDWVIAGGESGPGARPSHPDWYRSLRDQCAAADAPFLFKQWGEWLPINQQEEEFTNRLYKSRRVAKLHEDQGNLDDIYGRRCIVDGTVVHMDGSTHGVTEPMAFLQGTTPMTTFKVGKKAAGRQLDGIEHNGFPV